MVLDFFVLNSDFQLLLKNDLHVDNNFRIKFYLHLIMLLLQDYYIFLITFRLYRLLSTKSSSYENLFEIELSDIGPQILRTIRSKAPIITSKAPMITSKCISFLVYCISLN